MTPDQQALLDEYFATLSSSQKEAIPQVSAEYFCADEYNANECARLINDDVKRASCSLKAGYDADSEPIARSWTHNGCSQLAAGARVYYSPQQSRSDALQSNQCGIRCA